MSRLEEIEWHRVVFYDSTSKFVGEHLKKAHNQQEHGVQRLEEHTTEVSATEMQMPRPERRVPQAQRKALIHGCPGAKP